LDDAVSRLSHGIWLDQYLAEGEGPARLELAAPELEFSLLAEDEVEGQLVPPGVDRL
jgi:hypothetical protein